MWKVPVVVRLGRALGAGASLVACLSLAPAAAAQTTASEAAAPHTTEAADAGGTESPARRGSAFVDPLGFALFGPRLGVEAGGGHVSGALHARWFNAGLLSHSLFEKGDDKLAFGYGVGLRGRYYLSEGLAGLHLGVAAEYLHSRLENQPALVATVSGYVVPYAEVGYRLAFGRLYGDVSAGAGYAFKTSASVENLPGGSSAKDYVVSDESSVYGTASLELGIFF